MGQGSSTNKVDIFGTCDKNYEPVKEHFTKMLTEGMEENAQLCVYVDGKMVIDLYGTAVGDQDYNGDSLQVSLFFCKTLLLTPLEQELVNYNCSKTSKVSLMVNS